MGSGRGVVTVSACMSGTRGSCVLSSTYAVLEMGVVRGVGGVCDMCMCLARGGVGGEGDERGEWMRGLGLGFTNHVGTICFYTFSSFCVLVYIIYFVLLLLFIFVINLLIIIIIYRYYSMYCVFLVWYFPHLIEVGNYYSFD